MDQNEARNDDTENNCTVIKKEGLEIFTILCCQSDVLLVVTAAGWQCKRCNIEQLFTSQESMDLHLEQKHSILVNPYKKEHTLSSLTNVNDKVDFAKEPVQSDSLLPISLSSRLKDSRDDCMGTYEMQVDPSSSELRPCTEAPAILKNKIYCSFCNKEFKFRTQHYRHMEEVHGRTMQPTITGERKLISCRLCSEEFFCRATRLQHMRQAHGGKDGKPYVCEHCRDSFRYRRELLAHKEKRDCIEDHMVPDAKLNMAAVVVVNTFKIKDCDLPGTNAIPAMNMKLGNEGSSLQAYEGQSGLCDHMYHRQSEADSDHVSDSVTSLISPGHKDCSIKKNAGQEIALDTKYPISSVPVRSSTRLSTKRKMAYEKIASGKYTGNDRSDIRDRVCVTDENGCNTKADKKQELKNMGKNKEILPASSERKKYACDLCQQAFKFSSQRIRHMIKVHKQVSKSVRRHTVLKGDRKVLFCRFCDMKFVCRATRLKHVREEHGGAEGKPYACKYCDTKFRYRSKMLAHQNNRICRQDKNTLDGVLTDNSDTLRIAWWHMNLQPKSSKLKLKKGIKFHDSTLQPGARDTISCKDCKSAFERKYQIQIHRWLIHVLDENKPEKARAGEELKEMVASLMKHVDLHSELYQNMYDRDYVEPTVTFLCDLCNKEVTDPIRAVLRHIWNHYINPFKQMLFSEAPEVLRGKHMFLCTDCGEEIPDKINVISYHRLTVHNTADSYSSNLKCGDCGLIFQHKFIKVKHEINEHRPASEREKDMIICDICGEKLRDQLAFYNHRQYHNDQNELYPCGICNRSFHSESIMLKHRANHAKPSSSCSQCGKEFLKERALKRHMQTVHLGIFRFKCEHCLAKYQSATEFKDHMATKHEGKRPFSCNFCSETFVCRPTLKRHIRLTHEGQTPFICSICRQSFHEKRYLLQHKVIHGEPEPFPCPQCPKKLRSDGSLQKHIRIFHQELMSHGCSICHKRFYSEARFYQHLGFCKGQSRSHNVRQLPENSETSQITFSIIDDNVNGPEKNEFASGFGKEQFNVPITDTVSDVHINEKGEQLEFSQVLLADVESKGFVQSVILI